MQAKREEWMMNLEAIYAVSQNFNQLYELNNTQQRETKYENNFQHDVIVTSFTIDSCVALLTSACIPIHLICTYSTICARF
jgi:hypothetical protein